MLPPDSDSTRWFAEQVQVHEGSLRSWLRGKFPALSDPDNLVQESLARVWQARITGKVSSPKALLFTTARNLALDQLRRRQVVGIDAIAEIADLAVFEDGP